jgi:hypothetical protein
MPIRRGWNTKLSPERIVRTFAERRASNIRPSAGRSARRAQHRGEHLETFEELGKSIPKERGLKQSSPNRR